MNNARDKITGLIVEAEELKLYEGAELPEFECIDENCKIDLIPCSYKRSNKIRPYFKANRNVDHSEKCQFSRFLKLFDQAKKRKIEASEFEDLPYPSKLIKPAKKAEEPKLKNNNEEQVEVIQGTKRKSTNKFEESANSNRSVTTISQIVDFYLNFPFNRDIELTILDNTQQYLYWFRRIKENKNYIDIRIYFGKLHTNLGYINRTADQIEIKMYECEKWEETNGSGYAFDRKTQVNPYVIKVDLANLSSHKASRIMNELEFVINEKRKDFHNPHKNAFIFFLGKPTKGQNFSFDVMDGYLATRFTEVLLPSKVKK